MAWLESHGNLARHPKTRRLMLRMGWTLPFAIGNLHLLWYWALEYAPTGDLTKFEPEQLTYDLDLGDSTPEHFLEVMVEAGFLDCSADGSLRIHDWPEYTARSLRPKFRRYPERWHQILRSYGLPVIICRKSSISNSTRNNAPAPEKTVPSSALREPEMAEREMREAVRVDCVEDAALQGAGSGSERSQSVLRADPYIAPSDLASPFRRQFTSEASSQTDDDVSSQTSTFTEAREARSNDADASQITFPLTLVAQPNFTDTWWPRFLEMYKDKGCPLTGFEQRRVLERLARINGKPHTAVQMIKTALKEFEAVKASLPARDEDKRFANSS